MTLGAELPSLPPHDCVYATRGWGIHDERWVAALLEIGRTPYVVSWTPESDALEFRESVIAAATGGLPVLAGPLDSVGPVDFLGNPVGGGALFVLNEELRVPVWRMIRVAVFADGGNVWRSWRDAELELAVGAGLGLRLSTPVGLVWGDVAWPVVDRGGRGEGVQYYFGIGKTF